MFISEISQVTRSNFPAKILNGTIGTSRVPATLVGDGWDWPALKGIISDSNNIFLRYKLEDINAKTLFPKLQLITIFRLQVVHDYVH